ncbi:putative MATE efflux family protein 4, chloroplastic [Cardiosporidium cionae]|uniref:MATE efflux family protein 4, chloroplastic n=1 Tax=Cardiosporidium cionae TaxID=476202 RepID=A0ABQ7J912_9APIC|nr:putative MATE efflux family protein 4, chloroplastic [Cardiosporidium cionae]|eukprot:KAF8820444.1 putative MATE efflux family protein 4, chloroplastic [Cardiosporidium cionae]
MHTDYQMCSNSVDIGSPCQKINVQNVSSKLTNSTDSDATPFQQNSDLNKGNRGFQSLFIFCFCIMISYLQDPIISAIYSYFVGYNNTIDLAALGVSVQVFEGVISMFAFLAVASTNSFGAAYAEKRYVDSYKIIAHIFWYSVILGILTSIFLVMHASRILVHFLDASSLDMLLAAETYLKIRAVSAPAAIALLCTRGIFLIQENLMVFLRGAFLYIMANLAGLGIAVMLFRVGVAESAISSVVAQYIALLYIGNDLIKSIPEIVPTDFLPSEALPLLTSSVHEFPFSGDRKVEPALSPEFMFAPDNATRKRDWWNNIERLRCILMSPPGCADLHTALLYLGPCLLQFVGKVTFHGLITQICSSIGAVALAAHLFTLNVLNIFCTPSDALSQVVQAFLPLLISSTISSSITTNKLLEGCWNTNGSKVILRKMPWKMLLCVASVFGVLAAGASYFLVLNGSSYFTTDQGLIFLVLQLNPYLSLILLCLPFQAVTETALLAIQDIKFLNWLNLLFLAIPTILFHMRVPWLIGFPLIPSNASIMQIWQFFLLLQILRTTALMFRFLLKNLKLLSFTKMAKMENNRNISLPSLNCYYLGALERILLKKSTINSFFGYYFTSVILEHLLCSVIPKL